MQASAIVTDLPRIVLLVVVGLVLRPLALGQLERGADTALRQTVTGRVFLPDGSPAASAVVVTSAGGQALTGADGSFALAVELPLDAESLEVTAFADEGAGAGNLVASARIVPAALSSTTGVGTLALTLSPSCHPRWLHTFGSKQGPNQDVTALAVFDDGGGPALHASGSFTSAGGTAAYGIAKWDGSRWTALGTGFFESPFVTNRANVLCVHDDGSGPALFAGGFFEIAGGLTVNGIAKWDGASWSALAGGMTHPPGRVPEVHALAVFDDGSGPVLYAGGLFDTAGGVAAKNIAKWDGSNWFALGSGINWEGVKALAVYDDGSGPALYAGGDFTTAGGVAADSIAKWDGMNWFALGSGANSFVHALTVHDDGSGSSLFVGGVFTSAGGVAVDRVAKWDGSNWSALGPRSNNPVLTLTVYDDGSGPALYAGGFRAFGAITTLVEKWDGALWSVLGSVDDDVYELAVYDDGGGPALYAGGGFTTMGGLPANRFAKWDGSSWSAPGHEVFVGNAVHALAVHDDGTAPALYAGGLFTTAGGVPANRIARWNGSAWSALGSGMNSFVHALTVFDDGGGPELYAAGDFSTAGGVPASRIAKWNGSNWFALGGGISGRVNALAGFDDGGGPELYAGGEFLTVSGTPMNRIARWNGSTWAALGSGMNGPVHALAVHDDGSGPALYAGGDFTTAGGVAASRIAKWNGTAWSALGSGMNDAVLALTVFDDGNGPALYAGGEFTIAGGGTVKIARWDGSSWTALAPGFGSTVHALVVHDDGGGAALFAGGGMGKWVAKWNGASWKTLGIGINDTVLALASWDDGEGPALFAGGQFLASPARDSFLAKWSCRTETRAKKRKL